MVNRIETLVHRRIYNVPLRGYKPNFITIGKFKFYRLPIVVEAHIQWFLELVDIMERRTR